MAAVIQQSSMFDNHQWDAKLKAIYGYKDVPETEEQLLDLVASFDWDKQEELPIIHKDLKWIYVSALQKAIRRGMVKEAVHYARCVASVDDSYLWRRLAVIALEDVGMGNPLACALTLAAGKSKAWRKSVGYSRVLWTVPFLLARGAKDRSLTDLLLLAMLTELKKPTNQVEQVTHDVQDWWVNKLGSYRVVEEYRNPSLPNVDVSKDMWAKAVEEVDAPFVVKYMAARGRMVMRDTLYLPVIPNWNWLVDADPKVVQNPKDPFGDEMLKIAPVAIPAAALDTHVGEGRRAMSYWRVSFPLARKAADLIEANQWKAAIGEVMFYEEGALVDRQMEYKGRQEMSALSHKISYEKWAKITEVQLEATRLAFREGREAFNYARKRIMGLIKSRG